MAKELLERRLEEVRRPVTWKISVSRLSILDSYAKWVNREKNEVVEALINTLLDSREFNAHLNNGAIGKGK